jgi:hypothetical protein
MYAKITHDAIPSDTLITILDKPSQHNLEFYEDNKNTCNVPQLCDLLDLEKEMYVIFTAFPLGQFAERRRLDHPEWKRTIILQAY